MEGELAARGEGRSHAGIFVQLCDGARRGLPLLGIRAARTGGVLITNVRAGTPGRVIPGAVGAQRAPFAGPGCG